MDHEIHTRLQQAGIEVWQTTRDAWCWAINYDPQNHEPALWRIERGYPSFEAAALDAAEQLGLDYTVNG